MAEKKVVVKTGVKKSKIEARIEEYKKLINGELGVQATTGLNVKRIQILDLIKELEEAEANSASPSVIADLEERLARLREEYLENGEDEHVKASDVVDEVESVLNNANEKYIFVEIEDIEARIQYYKDLLASLDIQGLTKRRDELVELIEKEKTELEKLRKQKEEQEKNDKESSEDKTRAGSEFVDAAKDAAIADLVSRIANREAMIVARDMPQHKYDELEEWKKQLQELKDGKLTEEILENARQAEIKDLTERIANREAMLVARDMPQHKWDELAAWKARLDELQNPQKEDSEKGNDRDDKSSDLDARIKELEESIERHTKELEEVTKSIETLEGRDQLDVQDERRVAQHRLDELESIAKDKELFRIDDKYPIPIPELDEEAILAEYERRRTDMLDKYYGNADKKYEYEERMEYYKSHIKEAEFEYRDEDGKMQVGTYKYVEPYEGMEDDEEFLQLEEYALRLERSTKYEAGDHSVYNEVRDSRGVIRDPETVRLEDQSYVSTNNNAYNRLVSTHENLKTLGKYGEKVDYTSFQEGQPVRNVFRALGNAAKFVRNHTTAPINKAIGKFIVAPIYKAIVRPDENVAGLYSNKITHRYVARREYFASQGKGYFASRWNSIFKAKEGNKAILSAGAYDIQQSIRAKYEQKARQDALRAKLEYDSKSLDEKIAMLEMDMEKTTDPEKIAKFQEAIEGLRADREQKLEEMRINEQRTISQTRQTDAVDNDTHDIANKENVTRTVTGVKILTRFGIKKFIGPKLKQWLIERTKVPQEVETTIQVPQERQEWVPATYRDEVTPVYETVSDNGSTMSEVVASNAGKEVEGYYSVYGGERRPRMYEISGNEKVTSVFQSVDNRGTGLSDTAGLRAPTLTDRTFAPGLLDSNGVLRQDITIDTLIDSLGTGTVDPTTFDGVYVSIGDRYWVKLSDLAQGVTKQIQVGTTVTPVVDVPGHYTTITEMIDQTVKTTQMVDNVRVIEALKTMGVALDATGKVLLAEDIYENVRKTDTEVDPTKPQPRNYKFDAGFTGKKSEDYDSKFVRGEDEDDGR